jgi:hypothetical protein
VDPFVFKKSFKVAIVFGLLVAAYAGYVQVFAIVNRTFVPPPAPITRRPSATLKEAIQLAEGTFGAGHWTTDKDLSFRYYKVDRGYYMYAKDYQRLEKGKKWILTPFAAIITSRDRTKIQTVTSERAIVTLDKPLGMASNPDGSAAHVVHARLESDVRIRDDKGTPDDPDDDLRVSLDYGDYDEAKLKIESESYVVIEDQSLRATGIGMDIILRPREPNEAGIRPPGFDGAQTAILRKDVHIVMSDAGQTGGMFGSTAQSGQTKEPNPIDVRCDGALQIDLPPNPAWVRVGPPAPQGPTFATFERNVKVQRGKPEAPDHLYCDVLRLTLVRADNAADRRGTDAGPARADSEADDSSAGGDGFNNLAIRKAHATGHAVWLQSTSKETVAKGNELIYDKFLPASPDRIYLRADHPKDFFVQKVDRFTEGQQRGSVQQVTQIFALEATIFDDGKSDGASTIISRGAGELYMLPDIGKDVERTVTWQDELDVETLRGADKILRKKITLLGRPELIDPKQATLDANKKVVIVLRSKEADEPSKPADKAAAASGGGGATQSKNSEAYEIERLTADEDVHLTSGPEKLTARKRLVAVFKTVPPLPPAAGPAPAGTAQAAEPPQQEEESKPAKKRATVDADTVYAEIEQQPAKGRPAGNTSFTGQGTTTSVVKDVHLRGGVVFHQDPDEGKESGVDATGEAMFLQNLGNNRWKVLLADQDPAAPPSPAGEERPRLLAMATTEGHQITGPFIGLDQAADTSWVNGPGTVTLMTERSLFSDKKATKQADRNADGAVAGGDAEPLNAEDGAPVIKKKVPLKISFTKAMRFYGQAKDPKGKVTAIAEFYSIEESESETPVAPGPDDFVISRMDDALLACRMMRVYLDRPVLFNQRRPADAEADRNGERETRADIAAIECFNDVHATTRKLDPVSKKFLQQQKIEALDLLVYDRATGDFHVRGPGTVYLHNRERSEEGAEAEKTTDRATSRTAARPAADGGSNALSGRPSGNGRTADAAANAKARKARARASAKGATGAGKAETEPKADDQDTVNLTQIKFTEQMKGRFAMGQDEDTSEPRIAEFFGNVESLHGPVPNLKNNETGMLVPDLSYRHNADKRGTKVSFMTAKTMRVISEQPAPGSPEGTPSSNFLWAWKNVYVFQGYSAIEADRATFDSTKDLYYAYADDGHKVLLSHASGPGQPPSNNVGTALRYNRRTGESEVDTPLAFQLFDKAGARPVAPKKPNPAPPKRYRKLNNPSRNNVERKGFGGSGSR